MRTKFICKVGILPAINAFICCGIPFRVNKYYTSVSVNPKQLQNAIFALQACDIVISAPNNNGNFTIAQGL